MNKLLFPFVALAFLGAGCVQTPVRPGQPTPAAPSPVVRDTPKASPRTDIPPATSDVAPPTTPAPEPTPAITFATPRTLAATVTDATWSIHSNAEYGFEIMTPTKSLYAPKIELSDAVADSPAIQHGCISPQKGMVPATEATMVTLGTREFCVMKSGDVAAGHAYDMYAYTTLIGDKYLILTFTQGYINAGFLDGCPKDKGIMNEKGCVPFVEKDFEAVTDSIIGTFTLK
jgi:hypothetical protein